MHVGQVARVYQQKRDDGRLNPQEEGKLIKIRENVLSPEHGEQRRDIEDCLVPIMPCKSLSGLNLDGPRSLSRGSISGNSLH